tara:strand:+ start:396 stop:587 length:192 start_codon:yes stop_codon:yes gene_type:complete
LGYWVLKQLALIRQAVNLEEIQSGLRVTEGSGQGLVASRPQRVTLAVKDLPSKVSEAFVPQNA